MPEPKRTLKQKAYHGFKEYLIISCYLWLVFSLFVVYRAVLLSERVSLVAHGEALLNALALGKIMLIGRSCTSPKNSGGNHLSTRLSSGLSRSPLSWVASRSLKKFALASTTASRLWKVLRRSAAAPCMEYSP